MQHRFFRWLPVHVRWKRKGNNCILCFFTSFLTISKRKKIFIFILSLLKIARLWGNEISPLPGAWGLILQNDLNTLGEWAVDSKMFFNVDKCKVLHIGNRNVQANYTMNSIQSEKAEQEKDLGVEISSDLKPSKQCSEVVKTANKLIGFIGTSFKFRTEEIVLSLYNALVRPHLEYCVQCWSPCYKKDMEKLQGVQR